MEYLRSCGHNVSRTASVLGINRQVVYDILRKERDGNLDDRSKVPHHQPRRTPKLVEDTVVHASAAAGFGDIGVPAIYDDRFIPAWKKLNDRIHAAGAIALAFAGIFARLGASVTVLEKSAQILPGFDKEAATLLEREMRKDKVRVHTEAHVRTVEDGDGAKPGSS